MSILIKGMEMPPKGDYYITLYVCSDGSAYVDVSSFPDGKDTFEAVPAADVRPVVHGKWLSKEYMYGDPDVGIEDMWVERIAEQSDYYAYCSICGKGAGFNGEGSLILSDFCPNCGTDMRGDNNE